MSKQERGSCWSVTINNPVEVDEENIAMARQKGWKVDGQLEKVASGTPHYQLCVKTPQVRFSAVKKQFPRAHIEMARIPQALQKYVKKDDTKVGELLYNQEKYPSVKKVYEHMLSLEDLDVSWVFKDRYTGDQYLVYFDKAIKDLIEAGYYVEQYGVNPQYRSSIKNYGREILLRASHEECSQTDRQTDSQEVSLPYIDISEECQEQGSEVCESSSVSEEELSQDTDDLEE